MPHIFSFSLTVFACAGEEDCTGLIKYVVWPSCDGGFRMSRCAINLLVCGRVKMALMTGAARKTIRFRRLPLCQPEFALTDKRKRWCSHAAIALDPPQSKTSSPS